MQSNSSREVGSDADPFNKPSVGYGSNTDLPETHNAANHGSKKQSEAALFTVRVHLLCWTKPLSRRKATSS